VKPTVDDAARNHPDQNTKAFAYARLAGRITFFADDATWLSDGERLKGIQDMLARFRSEIGERA
jgi:hypothetical protein